MEKVIPRVIEVLMPEGFIVDISVKIPWLMLTCSQCKMFGYSEKHYAKKPPKQSQI